MRTPEQDNQACCAHTRVVYKRINYPNGQCSDSWECSDGCGMTFLPFPSYTYVQESARVDLLTQNQALQLRCQQLEKEVVRKEEEFISCVSHLESPHHCQIREPGNYIFLLKVLSNGASVTMFQKVVEPVLEKGEHAAYPCREWHEFRKDKKPWPIIPFKDYADYRRQTGQPETPRTNKFVRRGVADKLAEAATLAQNEIRELGYYAATKMSGLPTGHAAGSVVLSSLAKFQRQLNDALTLYANEIKPAPVGTPTEPPAQTK